MLTDDSLIKSILAAAGLPDAEISARVADIGPDDVAEVMVTEVACRATLLSRPGDGLMIQYDLGFGGGRLGYLLTLRDGAPYVEKGWSGDASATVRQDLVDLLRELFGPAGTVMAPPASSLPQRNTPTFRIIRASPCCRASAHRRSYRPAAKDLSPS